MALPLAPAVVLLGALRLTGEGSCPAIVDVATQVKQLGLEVQGPEVQVLLVEEPGALRIQRLHTGGAVVEERLLPAGRCEDLAVGAAVVISSWTSDLEGPGAPVLPSPRRLAQVTVTRDSSLARPKATSVARAAWVDLAAAAGLSWAEGGFAPGATVEVGAGSTSVCLGARLAIAVQGSRDLVLQPGVASWSRSSAALGPRCRLQGERWSVDLRVEALAALLAVRGGGFAINRTSLGGDLGLGAGARAGARVGRLTLFADLGLVAWLREERLRAAGTMATAEVPRIEGLLSLGLAWNVW